MSEEPTKEVFTEDSQEDLGEDLYLAEEGEHPNPRFVINRAERVINEQERTLETLRKQVERYDQIKLGFLALLGIFGLSSIGNGVDVGITEVMLSLFWFMLVSIAIVFTSVLSRKPMVLFRDFSPTVTDISTPHDQLLSQLNEIGTIVIEDRGMTAREMADEISKNDETIRALNHRLQFSYLIIFLILFIIPIIQFPQLLLPFG